MAESRRSESAPRAERPRFPAGYGISTEVDGMLEWPWADQRLVSSRNYWVSTAGPDRIPHAAPVWGLWRDSTLYFSTDPRSRKGQNLASQSRVVVHLESGDEVVIVEGELSIFRSVLDVPGLADEYKEKYGFDVATMPAESSMWIAVKPVIVHGWREADFPRSVTRWRFP